MDEELAGLARSLVAANRYLTLGTVDEAGRPWTTPVYFSADDELRRFVWMSTTTARHSQNLAAHPDVSLAIFDSTVPPYHGRCLYAAGTAAVLEGEDLAAGLDVYPGPPERGGNWVTATDVAGSSPWRLHAVEATELWVLCPREPRQPCPRHGRNDDHRSRLR